ncbi:MAG: hypothetical protein IJL17_02200 [Kiritimatiellae bacterium]|nr:hypothetical protein [Kiritimatiellia bacterium]
MSRYGTLIDNQLHPAPRAIRIGGAATALGKTRAEIDMFLDSIPVEG